MSFFLPDSLKYFLCLVLLYTSVSRAQIDLYSPDEFTTVAPNATVCSSTMIMGDLIVKPLNFSWTLDTLNYVNWTYQSLFYPVLGSIQCPRGTGLIYEGVWKCNNDSSKTGDLLARLDCPASLPEPTFGPGNTVVCAADKDYLPTLSCPEGFMVKSDGAGAWTCAQDNNYLAGATGGCVTGQLLRFVNGRWACANVVTDSDTLKALIPTCPDKYIPKYINRVWVCAKDNSVLGFSCPPNSRLQRSANGTTWICGPREQDTFRDITANCTGNRDTPFLTPNGWDCIPTPAINNSILLGTILYEWGLVLQSVGDTSTSPTSQLQPYLLPYAGQLRGFSVHVSPFGVADLTANLILNGAIVNTLSYKLGTSNITANLGLGIPFPQNSNLTFSVRAGNANAGYITIGVYAQVSAI